MKTYEKLKEELLNMQDPKNIIQPYILKKGGYQCYYIQRQVGSKRYMFDSKENFIELRELNKSKQGWNLLKRIYTNKVEIFNQI